MGFCFVIRFMVDNKKMLGKTDGKVINQKIVGENLKFWKNFSAKFEKKNQ